MKKIIIDKWKDLFEEELINEFLNDYIYFMLSKISKKVNYTTINYNWIVADAHLLKIKNEIFDKNSELQSSLGYDFKIKSVLTGFYSEYTYKPKVYYHECFYDKFDLFVSLKNLVDKFTFCKRMLELLEMERILYTNYLNIYNDWIQTVQGKSINNNSFTALKLKIEKVNIEAITKLK